MVTCVRQSENSLKLYLNKSCVVICDRLPFSKLYIGFLLNLKALSKFVADDILKLILLFFRENKA